MPCYHVPCVSQVVYVEDEKKQMNGLVLVYQHSICQPWIHPLSDC